MMANNIFSNAPSPEGRKIIAILILLFDRTTEKKLAALNKPRHNLMCNLGIGFDI